MGGTLECIVAGSSPFIPAGALVFMDADGMAHLSPPTCLCGAPLAKRRNAATCGRPECRAERQRWQKLMWWHKNRAKRPVSAIVTLRDVTDRLLTDEGMQVLMDTIAEMSAGTAGAIPEVDASGMADKRRSERTANTVTSVGFVAVLNGGNK